jgi:uncharacterized protein (TIGR02466 family)
VVLPIAASEVLTLFPTFVWKAQLEHEVVERVEAEVGGFVDRALASTAPLGRGESWQTDPDLQGLEAFAELSGVVEGFAAKVLAFLEVSHQSLRVTGCWLNANAPGSGHRLHRHPNNYLSGVYYLRVPERADTINFHDPRLGPTILRPPVLALTAGNVDQVVVRVTSGTLLLFPAWLEHSVDDNRSDGLRVSASFNLMFERFAETMSAPMWEGGRRGG